MKTHSRHWTKSSYPQSGGKPQELLNNQFVKDCDAAIALFWTRFGTPTDEYASGSEEEIEIMLESGKQVFMYFSDKSIPPTQINSEQYAKVQSFKEKYRDRGIYSTYDTDDSFKEQFFTHLSQYFLSLQKIEELALQNSPSLIIRGIHDDQLDKVAHVRKFDLSNIQNSDAMMEQIKFIFGEISKNSLGTYNRSETPYAISFYKPVEIDENTKEFIISMAKHLDIKIEDNFFNLGNLCRNTMSVPSIMGGGSTFDGSKVELKKYNDIIKLEKQIRALLGWLPIERTFEKLTCIKLALSNEGTTFDEDIDIELEVKTEMLLRHDKFEILPEGSLEYVGDDYISLDDLFSIKASAKYMDYESSIQTPSAPSYVPTPNSGLFYNSRDYEEEYLDMLDTIFDYQFYEDNDVAIVKLHVDYIRQHTSVAFPTPIFLTGALSDIPYRIKSKHNPSIVTGILKLVADS